jgi:hypothetical protein
LTNKEFYRERNELNGKKEQIIPKANFLSVENYYNDISIYGASVLTYRCGSTLRDTSQTP